MPLREATDAFIAGWGATRRLTGEFLDVPMAEATWMVDPTGRRMGELVAVDTLPERVVALYPPGERGAICALYSPSEPLNEHKRAFRALGWRLLRTEPMFVHPLRDLPRPDARIRRISDPGEVARVARLARMKPSTMGAEFTDDAPIRLYEAQIDGVHAGWVRSVKAGPDAWVSSLNVREPFRRRGLGRGLMAALLADDARLGRRASVLLASHTGALLYPTLGYGRVGTLMSLMPIPSPAT